MKLILTKYKIVSHVYKFIFYIYTRTHLENSKFKGIYLTGIYL